MDTSSVHPQNGLLLQMRKVKQTEGLWTFQTAVLTRIDQRLEVEITGSQRKRKLYLGVLEFLKFIYITYL